jgi:hypothetical protein
MKKFNKIIFTFIIASAILTGCTVSYKFSGINIGTDVETVSIQNFPNHAPLVQPTLSQNLVEALKDMFISQTRLQLLNNDIGDLNFEGKITGYSVVPQAIQGDEQASSNRLTITVQVKFTNSKDPKQDFDTSFSRYADFSSSENLNAVEASLNEQIIEEIVEDIFNKSVANW